MTQHDEGKTKKATPGGARPGAGAKKKLIDPVVKKVYTDKVTWRVLFDLGGGNFSAGIRRARELLEEHGIILK